MTLNPKSDIYDGNSSYQETSQKIEVNELNTINDLNQNIKIINVNNIKAETKLNIKNKEINKKNNIISKSINILPSIQAPNDLETYKVYSYSGGMNAIKEITFDRRNSNDLIIKNENIEKKEQPQKEIIEVNDNKEQSIDNNKPKKKKCCECCNCPKCCGFCYEKYCKIILAAILIILVLVTCTFLLGPACANCFDCFTGCEDFRGCSECCSECCSKCSCCKKKKIEEVNK